MKKISKFKMLFFTLILVLTVPTSIFASELETYGAGEWDTIFDKNVTATSSGTNTSTFTSGGGDIRVCISGVEHGNNVEFQFYTSSGPILPHMFSSNNSGSPSAYACLPKIDMTPYGQVNLYLKVTSKNRSSDTVRIVVQD